MVFSLQVAGTTAQVVDNYFSLTWDNDLMVGNDSGYTNGLFLSWISASEDDEKEAPPILVKPLVWSLDTRGNHATLTSTTVDQSMVTPEDITIAEPAEDEIPYSGLLFYKSGYLSIHRDFADSLKPPLVSLDRPPERKPRKNLFTR